MLGRLLSNLKSAAVTASGGSKADEEMKQAEPTSTAASSAAYDASAIESASLDQIRAREESHRAKQRSLAWLPRSQLGCSPEWQARLGERVMLAAEWTAAKQIRIAPRLVREVTDPGDAVVRVTATTVCGSDLHEWYNALPEAAMINGDITGHEAIGVVDSVGSGVHRFKAGARVLISPVIACGDCGFCKDGRTSLCDRTNPSVRMSELYGQRLASLFGYSQLTGGYAGCQAEFVRVPIADFNLCAIPPSLSDEQALMCCDVLCTAWHCNEMGGVARGDTVAVWGVGPIGLAAAYLAIKLRGAGRVIAIDAVDSRLQRAKQIGCEAIHFEQADVHDALMSMTDGKGPDVGIDAAGFRYSKSVSQSAQTRFGVDSCDVAGEIIRCVAKGGRVALIGDYFGLTNGFPIGAMMEKSLTVRGGQLYPHSYWPVLLPRIEDGTIDPSIFVSAERPFEELHAAYQHFADHHDVCKIMLVTKFGREQQGKTSGGSSSVGSGKSISISNIGSSIGSSGSASHTAPRTAQNEAGRGLGGEEQKHMEMEDVAMGLTGGHQHATE